MKQLILDQQKSIKSMVLKKRGFVFDVELLSLHKFISFVGWRRVGKTHTMIASIQQLVTQWVIKYEDVVFVDFNEIIGWEFDFTQLLSDYLTIYPDRKPFFVFDEIQEITNFQQWLFMLYNRGYKIFLSGSNSKILSSELTTHFRGKVREYKIQPLSLREYLWFHDFEIKDYYSTSEEGKLNHLTDLYINYGWYPEIALISDPHKKIDIAKTYLDVMIYKDIMERYHIENEYALKYCIKRILESSSKQLSIHSIFNDLKSQNIKISINSLYDILQYLQNVFFVSLLENYHNNKWQKKVYPIDTIYHHIYAKNTDFWQKFETMVYHHLKSSSSSELYYKKQHNEIDFTSDSLGNIQVCRDLNHGNIERETRSLSSWDSIVVYRMPSKDIQLYCAQRTITIKTLYSL